jgi:hypothetical protein
MQKNKKSSELLLTALRDRVRLPLPSLTTMNSKRTIQLTAALSERVRSYCVRGSVGFMARQQAHEGLDWNNNPAQEVNEQSG